MTCAFLALKRLNTLTELKTFQAKKTPHYWLDSGFKCTVVNQARHSKYRALIKYNDNLFFKNDSN